MRIRVPETNEVSFNAFVETAKENPLVAHELTHVVQQMSGDPAGRRLIRGALQQQGHALDSALAEGTPLDERTSRKVLEALTNK